MMWLKFLVQLSTDINQKYLFDKLLAGCIEAIMHLSNVKIITKLLNLKTAFIKTGIILSLAAYWGVILVGTFITFN